MSVRKGWLVTLLLIAAMIAAPVALRAQTDTAMVTQTTEVEDDDDDGDFPWGLLGLLGLLGLIPRKSRDVPVRETYTTRDVPPRDDRINPNPPPRV
jgi:MYXO-CTERM domain-containing protein